MKGDNQKDAQDYLRGLSLPRGQPISITYFGSKPSIKGLDLCLERLTPPKPTLREKNFSTKFPELGASEDKTAIANALESVLSAVNEPATFILITDGAEECVTEFNAIRVHFPTADLKVLQVGNSPNPGLQDLENKQTNNGAADLQAPLPLAAEPKPTPTAPIVVSAIIQQPETVDHWAVANWLEKYLWVFAYLCVAGGAWFLGARFGKMSIKVERAVEELEQFMRRRVEGGQTKDIESEDGLPPQLPASAISAEGHPDKVRSVCVFAFEFVIGLPLALFAGVNQMTLGVFAATCVVILTLWLIIKKPAAQSLVESESSLSGPIQEPYFPSKTRWRVALGATLLATTAVTFLMADLDKARAAAWTVLSSEFSGALAVVAGAPLLFVGARWWSFEQAKFTYLKAATDAVSEELRVKRAAEKKTKLDWDNLKLQISRWTFPAPYFGATLLSAFRISAAEKARTTVIAKAKAMALRAGGDKPSAAGNELYSKLLQSSTQAAFIRALIHNGYVQQQEDLWRSLADALDSGKSKKIAEAYLKLA